MRERQTIFIPADVLDLETVRLYPPEADEDPHRMVAPAAWRIVVAGRCRLAWDVRSMSPRVTVSARWAHDERALVAKLVSTINDQSAVVTFNGRRFDLPVILGSCMRHGIAWPWFFCTPGVRVRYQVNGHIDLCDELSDHGAATMSGLDTWGRCTGLGRKTESGTSVEALWQESPELVAQYCAGDVRLTAALYVRWLQVCGVMDAERAEQFQAAIRAAVATTGPVEERAEAAE